MHYTANSYSPTTGDRPVHDLIPLGTTLPGALTTAEIDATIGYAAAEKSLATREAYESDWKDFAAWCALRGATALPAHVGIVAAYLAQVQDTCLCRSRHKHVHAAIRVMPSRSARRSKTLLFVVISAA